MSIVDQAEGKEGRYPYPLNCWEKCATAFFKLVTFSTPPEEHEISPLEVGRAFFCLSATIDINVAEVEIECEREEEREME